MRKRGISLFVSAALAAMTLSACEMNSGTGERQNDNKAVERASVGEPNMVASYFSVYAYGPTKVMYRVGDEKAALLVEFPNQSKSISGTGKLFLFPEDTSEDMIQAWWNNQYSDAIFPDAAKPEKTINLGKKLEIISADMTGTERPRPDQSYDNFDVTYRIADIETDRFVLSGFEDQTTVHVMMEGKKP